MRHASTDDLDFNVETIFPPSVATNNLVVWNIWFFISSVFNLWRQKPDVLIVSLWRAYAVGIVVKLIRPDLKLVVFLHLPNDVHVVDRFLTRLSTKLAYRVWADSQVTLSIRLRRLAFDKMRVISFVTERVAALPFLAPRPKFIFWGRIHRQKGLIRSLEIFAGIQAKYNAAQFWIVGPDGGDLSRIKGMVKSLKLEEAVQFLGPKDFSGIEYVARNASFYLQTSESEGMAMSVVEAMQLGLIPVVTPVGEIARYACNGQNAVVVNDISVAISDVLSLLLDESRFRSIRANAISAWLNKPLYKDDVLQACQETLDLNHPS
jgi:glycosyltransferase involved in cell wall biosynthesis